MAKVWINKILSNNKLLKLAVGLFLVVTMLTSCAPAIAGPVTPVFDEKPNLASTTEASPTVIPTETKVPTATTTSTPEATATPEIEINICTAENFLNPENEINPESLFDGSYRKALDEISQPFDTSKIKNLQVTNRKGSGLLKGRDEIVYRDCTAYSCSNPPLFTDKGTEPFHRYITGHIVYKGITYAVMPIEIYDPAHPDQNVWVITLYRFLEPDVTEDSKIHAIEVWENDMNITPILSTNAVPRLYANEPIRTDPLVARTFATPNIEERIDKFVDWNYDHAGGGDRTALDGMVFLTNIRKTIMYK